MRAWITRVKQAEDAFWVVPALCIGAAIAAGLLVPLADREISLPDAVAMSGKEDTARAVLTAIIALGVSVAGVSFSVLAVALVLASQQLSPRVLRSFQRQSLNQAVLGLLLGSATYALFVLGSISDDPRRPVPELAVTLAMVLATAALGLFVVFLHHAVRSLNASVVIRRIAAEGHASVAVPYPAGSGAEPRDPAAAQEAVGDWEVAPCRVEVRAPRAGYIASVDGARLVAWATAHNAFVEQRRGIGSFVVTNAVLAVVRCHDRAGIDVREVDRAFRLEEERVVDGDIAFPIRQLVDIALKGLSPGINDPTTAENAMDSVTDTLVRFAQRDEPVGALRVDGDGVPRLRAIAPDLGDLVTLGFEQVRRDAASRPSFAVRLLELLRDLRESAPIAEHCPEIDRQAELIAEEAGTRADHQADQRLVVETYERLHGRDRPRVPA